MKLSNPFELYHYGIPGMRWGKRNGPPYPLSAEAHSRSEKIKGSKGLAKEETEYTKTEIAEYRKSQIEKYSTDEPDEVKRLTEASDAELAQELERRNQYKKAAVAIAAVVGVAGAGYLVYRASASKNIAAALKVAPPGTAEQILKSQSLDGLDDATKKLISDAFKNAGHDADYVLQAGQTFHRMHGFDDLDLSKAGDGVLYAAYKKADIDVYKAFLADFAGTGKRYDISLKAINDIVAPGDAQAAQIFDILCKNDPAYVDDVKRAYAQLIKKKLPAGVPNTVVNQFVNAQVDTAFSADSFNAMMTAFAVPGKAQTKMKQALKAAGYNAVFDYHDINDKITKNPVIFIDASSDLVKEGVRFVDADERVKALHM